MVQEFHKNPQHELEEMTMFMSNTTIYGEQLSHLSYLRKRVAKASLVKGNR
jgi:hypothetical protein